jgi:hypothetical protein
VSPSQPVLQPDVDIHAWNPPLPLPQQTPQPLDPDARPLGAHSQPPLGLFQRRARQRGRRVVHRGRQHRGLLQRTGLILKTRVQRRGLGRQARLKPVAAEVEEAVVGPVARRGEQDQQQERAVHARPVEEVGAEEEEEDEDGRGVGGDEEQRQPAGRAQLC